MTRPSTAPTGAVTSADAVGPYQEQDRVFWIDLVRAYAITTIVLTHTVCTTWAGSHYNILALFIGSASLFFMTSGALIFPVSMAPRQFYGRRFGSYMPQLILWSIIFLGLSLCLQGLPLRQAGAHIIWIMFTPTFSAGWFLYVLTGLYLFAPIISPWIARASQRNIEWFLLAWGLTGLIPLAQVFIPVKVTDTTLTPFFGYLGYMIAGCYLARWPIADRPKKKRLLLLILLAVIAIPVALRINASGRRWGYDSVLTGDLSVNIMAMNMLWFALFSMVKRAPAWLRYPITLISTCSLGIYFWHLLLLEYILPPGSMNDIMRFLITFVIATIMAWLSRSLRRCISFRKTDK